MTETLVTTIAVIIVIVMITTPLALIALLIVWLIRRSRKKNARAAGLPGSRRVGSPAFTSTYAKPAATVAPGWYPDVSTGGRNRWWTGSEWGQPASGYRAPVPTIEPAAPHPLPEAPRTLTRREIREAERSAEQAAAAAAPANSPAPAVPASAQTTAPAPSPAHPAPSLPVQPAHLSQPISTAHVRTPPSPPAPRIKPRAIRAQHGEWIPVDLTIEVNGYIIPGGLVYVGCGLTGRYGESEPALIDPTLKVKRFSPDTAGRSMDYWPRYDSITPEARAAYLAWLADGRRNPGTPVGYVFLFFYGLERRILIDGIRQPAEVHQIRDEVVALQKVYSRQSSSFDRYSATFIQLLDLILLDSKPEGNRVLPSLTKERWPIPLSLTMQIGSQAVDGTPISAEWAFAWSWFSAEIRPRTAGKRCAVEYAALFRIMFERRFPSGLIVKPLKRNVTISYSPASSGIGGASIALTGVSDVLSAARPISQLRDISDRAQDALESYSRYLGKYPGSQDTLPAIALLPAELLCEVLPALTNIRQWASTVQRDELTEPGELLTLWGFEGRDRLTKAETLSILQLAGKLGLSVEPDVRFGGPPLSADRHVLIFDSGKNPSLTPSPEYETAQSLAHLAVAVSAADGSVDENETAALMHHIESSLQLTEDERNRLQAHLRWLGSADVKLTGLTKRLASLTEAQKAALAALLIEIAANDGIATPQEIKVLMKIFTLLGHNPDEVTGRVHAALSGSRTRVTASPVTSSRPSSRALLPEPASAPSAGFVLDTHIISSTILETAKVSALLRDVFDEEEPLAPMTPVLADASPIIGSPSYDRNDDVLVRSLDAAHSALFRSLAGRGDISRAEFDAFAAQFGVLPNGALDALNEAAFDAVDEPLLEGDEVLTVNTFAFEEMVA
jgi:uncharacterized tellurite resistance protein B-like protein